MTSRTPTTIALTAVLLVMTFGTACFSYQASDPTAPYLGEEVAVELTGAGQDRLMVRSALALGDLRGQVLSESTQELMLRVRLSPERLGYGTEYVVDTLRIPRADIRDIGVRTLSTPRTIMGVTLALGGAVGVYALFKAAQSGNELGGEPGEIELTRIPLSSLLRLVGAFGR